MTRCTATGALPDHELSSSDIQVVSASPHKACEISPASIDIPCGDEFYRLPGVMRPQQGERVRDLIHLRGRRHSNSSPLEVGVTYAVPLCTIALPKGYYGYFNPKSSSGRVDVQCRVIVDGVSRFDTARPERKQGGYQGEAWLLITSNSFPIVPPDNTSLVQLRIFNGDTRFKQQQQLAREWKKNPLAYDGNDLSQPLALDDFTMSDNDGTLLVSADFSGGSDGVIGYSARKTSKVLDLRQKSHEIEDFFTPESVKGGEFLFAPGQFYLWRTEPAIYVPHHLAAELVAIDERIFEGRSHYAGFIDPGFLERVVLEIRCAGMLLRKGEPVARVRFERLTSTCKEAYDVGEHNYRVNTLVSKHFKRI